MSGADIVLAFGLVLLIEGLVYVLAPSFIEEMLRMLRDMPLEVRRLIGALMVTSGVILVYGAKVFGG